jgi:hypothetical protein
MRVPAMTPLPQSGRDLDNERAAQRAYEAFLEGIGELSPPGVQTWSSLHPRLRQCWIKAAAAARAS